MNDPAPRPTASFVIVHQFFYLLKWVGLRDRLRCPRCRRVGTWKPHGHIFDRDPESRRVLRWLCKWCGFYYGPEGVRQCYPDTETGVWDFDYNVRGIKMTPKEALLHSPISDGVTVANPWHG